MGTLCVLLCQAYQHSTLAVEAADVQTRAEANFILAGVLKDMGQFDKAEEVWYTARVTLTPSPSMWYIVVLLFYRVRVWH